MHLRIHVIKLLLVKQTSRISSFHGKIGMKILILYAIIIYLLFHLIICLLGNTLLFFLSVKLTY